MFEFYYSYLPLPLEQSEFIPKLESNIAINGVNATNYSCLITGVAIMSTRFLFKYVLLIQSFQLIIIHVS